MIRRTWAAVMIAAASAALAAFATVSAEATGQSPDSARPNPDFSGRWTLNRALSQFPRDVGFGVAIPGGVGSGEGGAGAFSPRATSEAEARNIGQLVDEVRTPPAGLTIVQSDTAISITDELGRSRRFRLDGRDEPQDLVASPVPVNARREGAFLVIRYKVERDREVRFTYSRRLDPPQLIVQTQFVERGSRDVITRVYEPARADEPLPALAPPARFAPPAAPPPAAGEPPRPDVPAAAGSAATPIGGIRPDAELRGITRLGLVVEGLDAAAASCGLKQEALEAAVTKSLTDAGLKVARHADEDTYVYVNIMSTAMTTGFCVSRYDAILYSYTTAKLSHSDTPLLVQVSLLRNGGVAGSAAGLHAEGVVKAIRQYVDQFAARIRNANR